jgi:zinc transporter, ZIP family
VFLTLAGSILYVVIQLLGVAAKACRSDLLAAGLTLGLLAGFAADAVVAPPRPAPESSPLLAGPAP